jgi:dTDP-4-amino-4,6-dideoxygalactose transaminase
VATFPFVFYGQDMPNMTSESALTRTAQIAVPFLDLGPSHRAVKQEILDDLAALIDRNAFTNGPAVGAFEEAFAAFCGNRECVGVASGLDALRLALHALDIGPGDEVIVPASTFIATFEAVSQAGATPVVAEVDARDYTLSADAAAAAVTDRTRAIMPVHLYGQLADMARLRDLARSRSLAIVEDACQAHGATRDGIRAGEAGTATAFSFYPGKNLGAFGDAGALVTDDESIAEKIRALREHGQRRKYEHDAIGYTARLDTIQAAVLLRKLPYLHEWNEARRAAARFYGGALDGVGDLVLPYVAAGSEPVWHLYVIRTPERESLADWLRSREIGVGMHYPQPVHLSPAYASLGHGPGAFPVTEQLAAEALSLPIFPGITEAQLAAVAEGVQSYFARGR